MNAAFQDDQRAAFIRGNTVTIYNERVLGMSRAFGQGYTNVGFLGELYEL